MKRNLNPMTSLIASIIPGAGQIYCGFFLKGMIYFLLVFFTYWLGLYILAFLIWLIIAIHAYLQTYYETPIIDLSDRVTSIYHSLREEDIYDSHTKSEDILLAVKTVLSEITIVEPLRVYKKHISYTLLGLICILSIFPIVQSYMETDIDTIRSKVSQKDTEWLTNFIKDSTWANNPKTSDLYYAALTLSAENSIKGLNPILEKVYYETENEKLKNDILDSYVKGTMTFNDDKKLFGTIFHSPVLKEKFSILASRLPKDKQLDNINLYLKKLLTSDKYEDALYLMNLKNKWGINETKDSSITRLLEKIVAIDNYKKGLAGLSPELYSVILELTNTQSEYCFLESKESNAVKTRNELYGDNSELSKELELYYDFHTISGYVIAAEGNAYEVMVIGNSYRSILITTQTEFPSQSYFELLVKDGPSRKVPLKNGFRQTWKVYYEVSESDIYEKRQKEQKVSKNRQKITGLDRELKDILINKRNIRHTLSRLESQKQNIISRKNDELNELILSLSSITNYKLDTELALDSRNNNMEYIMDAENKYLSEIQLFSKEPLRNRLKKILGDYYDIFLRNISTLSPMKVTINLAYTSGLAPHQGGSEEASFCYDYSTDTIYIGLLTESTPIYFSEGTDPFSKFPQEVQKVLQLYVD